MSVPFPGIQRWIVALAGTVLQMGLGTVYAWSYFQALLVKWYRWSYVDTAWAFSLLILSLGFSAAWAGFNLPRFGARKLAIAGAVLFALSYVLGGLALHAKSLPLFYLGYSVVGGIGIGFGYVTPVATVTKWFPDKRGLMSGVVVMGFGFGALLMSKLLAPAFLRAASGDLVTVFETMGVAFAVVLIPISAILREPPALAAASPASQASSAVVPRKELPAKAYLFSSEFVQMWLMFFCNISAGISIISMQSPLVQEVWERMDPSLEPMTLAEYGATLIAVSSLFNGVGRVFWGLISDRIGRIAAFRVIMATQMIVFGFLMTEHNPWIFSGLCCYVLLCFGGGFGTMPAFVSDVFGASRMPLIYGTMLTAWASAGIAGPLIVATLKDNFPDRAVIYCFLCGVLFLGGGVIVSFLTSNDPLKPGKPASTDIGIDTAVSA